MTVTASALPPHIEDAIAAISEFHAQHKRAATPIQRFVGRLTTVLGRPEAIGIFTAIVALWVVLELLGAHFRVVADPSPFSLLQGVVTLFSVYITLLILATQQRDDLIASHREQLTLQLAILGEQKSAKIISLLEDLRRDHPGIANRVDAEALAMSMPADPQAVLDAIKESQTETDAPN